MMRLLSKWLLAAAALLAVAYLYDGVQVKSFSAALIAALSQQGIGQLREAWGYLTPEQQQALAPEFQATLAQFGGLTQGQIGIGRESLATREAGVVGAVDLEVINSAANVQAGAASTFSAAADKFAAWVSNLPGSFQIIVPAAPEVNV